MPGAESKGCRGAFSLKDGGMPDCEFDTLWTFSPLLLSNPAADWKRL